ncbi:MAG: hypothetical protein Q9193_003052 [Seirophora villosa]
MPSTHDIRSVGRILSLAGQAIAEELPSNQDRELIDQTNVTAPEKSEPSPASTYGEKPTLALAMNCSALSKLISRYTAVVYCPATPQDLNDSVMAAMTALRLKAKPTPGKPASLVLRYRI